jgi:hypothetical protein
MLGETNSKLFFHCFSIFHKLKNRKILRRNILFYLFIYLSYLGEISHPKKTAGQKSYNFLGRKKFENSSPKKTH